MQPPRPFQPDGIGGAELFADPEAYTPAYHDAHARELERRAGAAANTALADALRCVAHRHRATALALAAAEPAGRGRGVAAGARSVASSSFGRRTVTARSA
jgi:hypothetical protein